ncbi:hypothetical protein BDN72DRAFT_538398 [Pluteus cervinus]|uniref:Uncharacterized protein n=1 Tax=Pluteus cervinus TaxID=181527 RepID=A0ACD3AXT8_9AGAR|nr:hypothetical protein BDN72DRAFT_538398 [Pluteus cervinus]
MIPPHEAGELADTLNHIIPGADTSLPPVQPHEGQAHGSGNGGGDRRTVSTSVEDASSTAPNGANRADSGCGVSHALNFFTLPKVFATILMNRLSDFNILPPVTGIKRRRNSSETPAAENACERPTKLVRLEQIVIHSRRRTPSAHAFQSDSKRFSGIPYTSHAARGNITRSLPQLPEKLGIFHYGSSPEPTFSLCTYPGDKPQVAGSSPSGLAPFQYEYRPSFPVTSIQSTDRCDDPATWRFYDSTGRLNPWQVPQNNTFEGTLIGLTRATEHTYETQLMQGDRQVMMPAFLGDAQNERDEGMMIDDEERTVENLVTNHFGHIENDSSASQLHAPFSKQHSTVSTPAEVFLHHSFTAAAPSTSTEEEGTPFPGFLTYPPIDRTPLESAHVPDHATSQAPTDCSSAQEPHEIEAHNEKGATIATAIPPPSNFIPVAPPQLSIDTTNTTSAPVPSPITLSSPSELGFETDTAVASTPSPQSSPCPSPHRTRTRTGTLKAKATAKATLLSPPPSPAKKARKPRAKTKTAKSKAKFPEVVIESDNETVVGNATTPPSQLRPMRLPLVNPPTNNAPTAHVVPPVPYASAAGLYPQTAGINPLSTIGNPQQIPYQLQALQGFQGVPVLSVFTMQTISIPTAQAPPAFPAPAAVAPPPAAVAQRPATTNLAELRAMVNANPISTYHYTRPLQQGSGPGGTMTPEELRAAIATLPSTTRPAKRRRTSA